MTGDPLERLNTVVAWEMFRKPSALLGSTNTDADVWADTVYRSNRPGFISRVHRKKPRGRPMPKNISTATGHASEPVPLSSMLSPNGNRMGLFIRTIVRSRPRQHQNRRGQFRLQFETFCLVAAAEWDRMSEK